MPYNGVFDASTVTPKQAGGGHPVGNKFPFRITNTEAKKVKDKETGLFEVEFTSEAGSIKHNYNLWSDSEVARRISGEQLSALCHAVGIFQVDFKNDGAALRGAMGMMDIGFQKGHEPSAEKPEGGYVELKKVYDRNGNEPGKPPAAGGAMPSQQAQPQAQANSGFTAQPAAVAQPAVVNAQSWGGPANNAMPEKAPWGG